MSREEKLAKNTFILAIGTFLPKLASFITLPILTAYLTKEEYGTFDLVTVLVSFILPVATLQIQTAAFRFLIDVRQDEEKTKSIITNILCFIVPTSIIALFVLFFLLPGTFNTKILICLYYFLDIIVNASRQIARGLNKSLDYTISSIISALGKLFFALVFVLWLKKGLNGAIASLLLASTISFVILSIRIQLISYIELDLLNKNEIIKLIKYSWPMIPNSMSMTVMRVSDRFVISLFMGLTANAVYSVANKIPSLLTLAQTTFTMAWQESASMAQKDEDASAYYSSMFRTVFDFMAGALGILICATPLLFKLLIRGDYGEAYPHIVILLLAMFFYSQCAYLGGLYLAYKKTREVGVTTMMAAACNFIIDIASIHYIGLYAASGSTLISYMLLFIFRLKDVKKFVELDYNFKHILLVFSILVLESFLCVQQNGMINTFNMLFGMILFYVINKELISKLFSRIKSKLKA